MAVAVAVAVAGSGGGAEAVPVPVAGLTKRFFNHIQKDFLINVWGYFIFARQCGALLTALLERGSPIYGLGSNGLQTVI